MRILENQSLKEMKRMMKSKILSKKAISSRNQMRMNEVLLNQINAKVSKLCQIMGLSNRCSKTNSAAQSDSGSYNSDLRYDRKENKNNFLSNNYKSEVNHQSPQESLIDFIKNKASFKVNQQEKQKEEDFQNEINEQQLEQKKGESYQDQKSNFINQSKALDICYGNENSITKQKSVNSVIKKSQIKFEQNDNNHYHSFLIDQYFSYSIIKEKNLIRYETVIDDSIKQNKKHFPFSDNSNFNQNKMLNLNYERQRHLPASQKKKQDLQYLMDNASEINYKNKVDQERQFLKSMFSWQDFHNLISNYSWFRKSSIPSDLIYEINFQQIKNKEKGNIIEKFKEFIILSKNIKDQYQKLNAQVKSITFTSFHHYTLMKECLLQNQWLNYQHIIIKQNKIQQNWQHLKMVNLLLQNIVQLFTSQKSTFEIHLDLLFPQYLQAIQQIEIKNHLFIHIKCMTKQTFQILRMKNSKNLQYINIIYNNQCPQNIKEFNLLEIQQKIQKKEIERQFISDQKYLVSLQMKQYLRKVQKIKKINQQNFQQIQKIQKDGKIIYKIKNDQFFDLLIQQQSWQEVKQIWFEKVITVSQWGKFVLRANYLKNLESIFLMKQNKNEFLYHFVKSQDILKFQKLSKIGFSINDQFQLANKKTDKQFQFYCIEIISKLEHLHNIGSQCFSDNRQMVFSVLNVQLLKNQYLIKSQITVGKNLTDDIKRFAYFDGEQ